MYPSRCVANDSAVFGLHQAVVAALPGPALGLFDAQFFEQLGDGLVDELTAVVGVKAQDAKRKTDAAYSPEPA